MRTLLVPIFAAAVLCAQNGPQKIENVCTGEDVEALGLDCSEDAPCPVYIELTSADGFGANLFLAGNLHTSDTTIAGLLLASSDSGKTWTEPVKRIRAAALERVQFVDSEHGWVSGSLIDPLPRNPFLWMTVNGGGEWHRVPISSDREFGSILEFWFDSAARGQLVLDRSQGKSGKYELFTTSDGGETWSRKSSSEQEIHLASARPPDQAAFRVLASQDVYQVQRRTSAGWETLARFPIRAGECK